MSDIQLFNGDCLEVLKTLPNGSVDAVITDPPYPEIDRAYGRMTESAWHAMMDGVVPECRRILKPTGSAVFVLQPNSDRVGRMRPWLWEFMAKWTREWGMVQDAWWWNNAALPTSVAIQGRLLRASMKACVWLGSHGCWRDQNAVLVPPSDRMKSWIRQSKQEDIGGRVSFPSGQGVDRAKMCASVERRGGVIPFNVIATSNGHQKDKAGCFGHGAGTPSHLCDWWLRYICPPGGTVLDPFIGSGTVGISAVKRGCDVVGIERDPGYFKIATDRIAAAQAARAELLIPA